MATGCSIDVVIVNRMLFGGATVEAEIAKWSKTALFIVILSLGFLFAGLSDFNRSCAIR